MGRWIYFILSHSVAYKTINKFVCVLIISKGIGEKKTTTKRSRTSKAKKEGTGRGNKCLEVITDSREPRTGD